MKFVESVSHKCVFCAIQEHEEDTHNLVVWRGDSAFVILNRYPYTSGHLLVIANQHRTSLEELSPACRAEMMELAVRCMTVLRGVYHPDGFNLGANVGEAAGAGIPGHAHLHIVPRWTGDASFMLTLAETKVMNEELGETHRRICAAWEKKNCCE